MERTQPVYITNVPKEVFIEQYDNCDDKGEDWQDLELFWGVEKQRLQDIDARLKPLSSSLEEHFLSGNFLKEPEPEENLKNDLKTKTVKGEDIADIPTIYKAEGFKPRELIVIGTYVDKDIIPGFRYKVRKNLSDEYLFGGKAKYVEGVGLGYGKRITFESDTSRETNNFFWSDSRSQGYGFTFQAISDTDTFNILDTKTGNLIGRVLITNPALEDDHVLSTTIGELGYVEKEVAVKFSCIAILSDTANKQSLFVDDVKVRGKAIVVRESASSKAKITQIFLKDFIVDSCLLVPEE